MELHVLGDILWTLTVFTTEQARCVYDVLGSNISPQRQYGLMSEAMQAAGLEVPQSQKRVTK